jgi:hypothetical protein
MVIASTPRRLAGQRRVVDRPGRDAQAIKSQAFD